MFGYTDGIKEEAPKGLFFMALLTPITQGEVTIRSRL